MSDALTFVINVKSEDAISSVQRLKLSFAGLSSAFNTVKNIGLVQFSQSLQDLSGSIKEAAAPGLDFQQGMADLSAITGITGKELDTLGIAAREMGKKSGIGAGQAVEAFKLLASNIDVSAIGGVEGLKKLQQATITLSQAAGTDLPMAANTMSFALNQFQLPVSEAARMINVLGAGAKYGAAEIPDLAESLKNAGSVAHQAGLTIEDATGAIEILSQRGIKGAEAGTALRNVLLKLQTEEIPGVDLRSQGLSVSLGKMKGMMNDTVAMEKIFGRENINAAQILIGNSEAVGEMTSRVTGTNVAFEQAEIRTRTYKHTLEEIKAKIDDVKIGLFKSTGALVPWVEVIGEAAARISRVIPALGFMKDAMIGALGSIVNLVKGLKAAKTAQEALNFAFTKSPWGAIITGAILLGGALLTLNAVSNRTTSAQKELNEIQLDAAKMAIREKEEVDKLFITLNKTIPQSKERAAAIKEINDRYGEMLPNMLSEKSTALEIADAYKAVTREIDKKTTAEAMSKRIVQLKEEIFDQLLVVKKAQDAVDAAPQGGMEAMKYKAFRLLALESARKDLSAKRSVLDYVSQQQKIFEISLITGRQGTTNSPGGNTVVSGGKPLVPGSTETNVAKESAANSLSGDSHAIKNTYINFESFIHQNTNITENGQMSFSDMERMMRQFFYRMINDANNAN